MSIPDSTPLKRCWSGRVGGSGSRRCRSRLAISWGGWVPSAPRGALPGPSRAVGPHRIPLRGFVARFSPRTAPRLPGSRPAVPGSGAKLRKSAHRQRRHPISREIGSPSPEMAQSCGNWPNSRDGTPYPEKLARRPQIWRKAAEVGPNPETAPHIPGSWPAVSGDGTKLRKSVRLQETAAPALVTG